MIAHPLKATLQTALKMALRLSLHSKYLAYSLLFVVQANTFAAEPSVQYSQVDDESIVGRLWLPAGTDQNPAILLIGGSSGAYENADAQWLSSLGFVVLDVRFFGAPGMPKNLTNVPIEYFHNAVDWLNNHHRVKPGAIGLFGHSKGSEAVILTAYHHPLVKAVVARAPSAIVWGGSGLSGFNKSSWSWNDAPIDFHRVGLIDGGVWLSRVTRKKKMIKTSKMFENALRNKEAVDRARLPVEHLKTPLLFLSGSDDQQWPSTAMADMLIAVLDASNFAFNYQHIAFDNAGHRPGRLSQPDDTFANGGTMQGNRNAHQQTQVVVKAFFDENLR